MEQGFPGNLSLNRPFMKQLGAGSEVVEFLLELKIGLLEAAGSPVDCFRVHGYLKRGASKRRIQARIGRSSYSSFIKMGGLSCCHHLSVLSAIRADAVVAATTMVAVVGFEPIPDVMSVPCYQLHYPAVNWSPWVLFPLNELVCRLLPVHRAGGIWHTLPLEVNKGLLKILRPSPLPYKRSGVISAPLTHPKGSKRPTEATESRSRPIENSQRDSK